MERKRKLKLKKLLAILLVFAMITPLVGDAFKSLSTMETYAVDELSAKEVFNEPYQNIVTETFFDNHLDHPGSCQGDHSNYSIRCLLNSFNVVSMTDIESKHIVGPIAANGAAYHSRPVDCSKPYFLTEVPDDVTIATVNNEVLVASDLSRGVCSFVRDIFVKQGSVAAFNLGFGFSEVSGKINGSNEDILAQAPYLYTNTELLLKNVGTADNYKKNVIVSGLEFSSPYNQGDVVYTTQPTQYLDNGIKQNDNYIDFSVMFNTINSDSLKLLENGTLLDGQKEINYFSSLEHGETLEVEAGKSYTVTEASQLTTINIVYPDGYDYFDKPVPGETIVNFEVTEINPTQMDDKKYSRFPEVLINGVAIDFEGSGEHKEYSEYGNKIIYNMPNIVTTADGQNRVMTYGNGQNIPGHMIMPNAEYWNLSKPTDELTPSNWEGGNINGSIICKAFRGGLSEIHMWAYDGLHEQSVKVELEAEKYIKTDLSAESFTFKLTPYKKLSDNSYKLDSTGAIMVDSVDGKINFQPLLFAGAGTYKYLLEEVDDAKPGYIYDKSKYEIIIEITGDTVLSSKVTYNKVTTDDLGNILTSEEVKEDEVDFINELADQGDSPLPATGGAGNSLYIVSGMALMIYASIRIFKREENL